MFQKLKNTVRMSVFLTSFAVFFALCHNAFALQLENLTVLAEPNMTTALTKISRIYSQNNGIIVSINFSSSADLISDIEEGEPSDVFISAHRYWIEDLKQKGLVDIYNISHIADDSLVLVTSRENNKIPQELFSQTLNLTGALQALNRNQSILIVDHEGNSLGQYSEYILSHLELPELKIFKKLHEDRTSISSMLVNNLGSYTLLLASQVKDNKDFRVLSNLKNQHIFYQALVIASDNMDNARKFLQFLKSKQAKQIFRDSGFIVEN